MTKTWKDLQPDPVMVLALDEAGPHPAPEAAQNEKKNWSKSFADACALMLAEELRRAGHFKKHHIYPDREGNKTEFVTSVWSGGKGKKVDVSVSTVSGGLQLALTLKGGNFPDPGDGAYGKNVTGRLYELRDETRAVHEYHPHTTMLLNLSSEGLNPTERAGLGGITIAGAGTSNSTWLPGTIR